MKKAKQTLVVLPALLALLFAGPLVSAAPRADPAAAKAQLDLIDTKGLQDEPRRQALDAAWVKLQPAMLDPNVSDVEALHQLARLAVAVGNKRLPIRGKQLAAVVGDALIRHAPDHPQSKTLMPKLVALTGQAAIDRLARTRDFNLNTLTDAAAGDPNAQHALSLLYDELKIAPSSSPVFQHPEAVLHWLHRATESGSHDAARQLAYRYRHRIGVKHDLNRAEALLRQAFRDGDMRSEQELWDLFSRRTGSSQKIDKPIRQQLETKAKAGDAMAKHELALMLRRGRGGPKDHARARMLLQEAWQDGISRSAVRLGAMNEHGEAGPKGGKAAETWYRKAAEQGDIMGQHYLGQLYRNGAPGIKRNGTESLKWHLKAAKAGYVGSQSVLGGMYSLGMGVRRDQAESLRWTRLAAEQGDMIAASNLGMDYYNGDGVERDYYEAEKWLKLAEQGGMPLASNLLGLMYRDGKGVEQDYELAMRYFQKDAKDHGQHKGLSAAKYNIGKLYAEGLGVKLDYKEAAKWFKQAANQNNGYAMFSLAQLFEQGQGVKKDFDQAIRLYRKAAALKYVPAAIERLKELGVPYEEVEKDEAF
jgi:hypothetical protein